MTSEGDHGLLRRSVLVGGLILLRPAYLDELVPVALEPRVIGLCWLPGRLPHRCRLRRIRRTRLGGGSLRVRGSRVALQQTRDSLCKPGDFRNIGVPLLLEAVFDQLTQVPFGIREYPPGIPYCAHAVSIQVQYRHVNPVLPHPGTDSRRYNKKQGQLLGCGTPSSTPRRRAGRSLAAAARGAGFTTRGAGRATTVRASRRRGRRPPRRPLRRPGARSRRAARRRRRARRPPCEGRGARA